MNKILWNVKFVGDEVTKTQKKFWNIEHKIFILQYNFFYFHISVGKKNFKDFHVVAKFHKSNCRCHFSQFSIDLLSCLTIYIFLIRIIIWIKCFAARCMVLPVELIHQKLPTPHSIGKPPQCKLKIIIWKYFFSKFQYKNAPRITRVVQIEILQLKLKSKQIYLRWFDTSNKIK